MKFFLIVACAAVAFAAPELKWSEDGQYKVVDSEPVELRVVEKEPLEVKIVEKEPVEIKYIEKEPLKIRMVEKEPVEVKYIERKPLELDYVPISYGIPMAYRRVVYRDFEPFTYHYEQRSV